MFSLIGSIIIGFVVGLIARAIKPGNDKLGLIMTSILGIAGAFLANFIGQKMGWYAQGEVAGWIASVVGAMLLLFIYSMVKSKT